MITHSTKILYYVWKPEIRAYSIMDTKNYAPLYWIIGQQLTELFTNDNEPKKGLNLARLQIGCSEIIAHKRITDIMVTINTYKNN